MSKLIKDATLLGIADAIRAKTGTTDPIKVGSFASAIEGIDTGATDGMFCWAKYEDNTVKPEFNAAVSGVTMTDAGESGYSIVSGGSDGWGNHAATPLFSIAEEKFKLSYTITAEKKEIFFGISGTLATTYSAMEHAINLSSSGVVLYYKKGTQQGGSKGSYTAGDVIDMEVEGSTLTISLNGTALLTESVSLSNISVCVSPYTANTNYGTILPIVGASILVGYVLSDNLNAYPQDGYHTDGYYYKLLENDIQWDERGQYAWSKNETEYVDGELTFPTIASATLTATSSGGYTLTSGSSGGWGYTYLISDLIDTTKGKLTLNYTIAATGLKKGIFVGVADTPATTYTNLNHSYYLSTGANEVLHWQKGTQIAVYETVTTGDVLTMTVEGTTMTVSKNGTVLFTDTLSFTDAYACIILYTGGATYGVIECTRAGVPSYIPVGYLVGNAESAYPNDGYADDGYYYMKVGATKVSPKYASGQTIPDTSAQTLTVSGLGFRPYAVAIYHDNSTTMYDMAAFGVCDALGTPVSAVVVRGNSALATATFIPNDDGFTYNASAMGSYSVAVNWYAIGY